MNNAFPRLFEPGQIGNVTLKNRVVKAPQHTGLCNPDGSVTERLLRHYRSLAKGGAGLVTVEYAWVDMDASKAAPLPARHRERRAPARPLPACSDHPGERREGLHPDLARRPPALHAAAAQGRFPRPVGGDLRPRLPRSQGADLRRDPRDREGLRAGGPAGRDGRLRHGRAPRLPRLPHLELPLPPHQQAHRLVRRLAREPHALPARGGHRDQEAGEPLLPRASPGSRAPTTSPTATPSRRPSSSPSAWRLWEWPPST